MSMPMGMAMAAAMMKATHTRRVETPACHSRFSDVSILHSACSTRLGEGRNCGATQPVLAATSHAPMTIAAASSPTAISAIGGARPRKLARSRKTLLLLREGLVSAIFCTDRLLLRRCAEHVNHGTIDLLIRLEIIVRRPVLK